MTASIHSAVSVVESGSVIRLADFEIRPRERRLSKGGEPARIGSRAFDLLLVLVERRDAFVTADELRRRVWPDRAVEDNNLRVHLSALRKILGPQAIVHHATLGYRLALEVRFDGSAGGDAPAASGNLPPRLTPVFGRDAVIDALGQAIAAHTRVSIVGTAGVGKTTLALTVAEGQARRFADGAWFVDLAPLTSGMLVVDAVAHALQVRFSGDATLGALVKALASRSGLVVLDNCEHLVPAVTALSDALLKGAPGIVLLATSRKPLRSAGEHVIALGPLDVPVAADAAPAVARRSGALALFESRAQAIDQRFALTAANVGAAIEVCRRLDGIALALVLAASRVPMLGVSGVLDRLREGVLSAARGTAVDDRHRTLQAALEWSTALLGADELVVFRRLGTFAGSFSLDDLCEVCADDTRSRSRVAECVDALIEDSLIVTDAATIHGLAAPRYAMHAMIRAHAVERLDAHADATTYRRRHAEHFAIVAEGDAGPGTMKRPDREQSLPEADHDNLRAALDWAVVHDADLALRLATATTGFWRLRAHHAEAIRRCDEVLALPDVASEGRAGARARLMTALCGVAFEVNRHDLVDRHATTCRTLYERLGDERGIAQTILWSAIVRYVRRDLEGAMTLYLDARQRCRDCGDRDGEANALANLASAATELDRYDEAVAWLREALPIHRALGSHWGVALDMENLGEVAFARGDLVAAHADWVVALAEYRAVGHEFRVASMLQHLAAALCRLDRLQDARECLAESLALCRRGGFDALFADGLGGLAAIAAASGDGRMAVLLLRVAARERERLGCLAGGIALRTDEESTRIARATLDERQWLDACVDADRLSVEQVVALFDVKRVARTIGTR